MKHVLYYLLSFLLLTFVSCKDSEETPEVPFIEIGLEGNVINFPIEGGSEVITIISNVNDLRVEPKEQNGYEWCNTQLGIAASNNHILTVSVSKNEGLKTREAEFMIIGSGVEDKLIKVAQLGSEPAILANATPRHLSKEAQEITIEITSNTEFKLSNSEEWLKLKTKASRSEMVTTSFTYTVDANDGFAVRRDAIVVTPVDETIDIKVEIPVEQDGADVDDVIPDDIKVGIKSVEMLPGGTIYGKQYPELTIDGNYDSYYGSGQKVSSPTDPIELVFTLEENIDRIDYVILHQRKGATVNNQLTKGYLYYKHKDSEDWIECGSYDKSEIVPQIRIDVNIQNPYQILLRMNRTTGYATVSLAEFECYQKAEGTDYDLEADKAYFEDDVFSKLKPTTTPDDIAKITHPMVRAIAQELLDGTYSTEFRSRTYYSCKNPQIVGNELTIGKRSICDNPTGIFFKAGKKYIVFAGDDWGVDELKLYIKDWRENGANQTITLTPGLNIIEPSTDGAGYIQYWTETDLDTPHQVNVHFCYGTELGFWDVRAGHDNEYWKTMLQNAVNTAAKEGIVNAMMDVCGEKVQIINKIDAFNFYCPNDIESVMKEHDELMTIEYTVMGLVKNNVVPKNRMLGVRSWGGSPNWNGTCANYPNNEEAMLNPVAMRNNIWVFGHEFGHGNQVRQMKGAGWAEVTNNIYAQHCMYLMNNKQCRLEHTEYKRQGYDNKVYGDRFNAYLNDALVKGKPYLTHEGGLVDDPEKGEYYSSDPFTSLAPLWQLSLFYMFTEGAPWYKPDFWGDVHWAAIQNVEGTPFDNHGQRYCDFMKRSMDAANMNLTDFFVKMGLLREINFKVGDYGPAKQITITKEMVDEVKAYGDGKPQPATPVINYISGNTVEIYRQGLAMSGTYNQGITDGENSKTISHSVWKNAVAFETYDADGKMIEVCIAGTGCIDNSSTYVRYPEGAAYVMAVSWDGKRELVCGTKN